MKKYILIFLLLTGCGTTYQLSTINHEPIYTPNGSEIKFDIVKNEFELARKFRTDDKFRWNFAHYAMNQDLRWHYDFYWNNRMYRSVFASPFDFYWNSNQYWWSWSSNYPFNYRFNYWNRFGFYRYSSPWNNWGHREIINNYAWENRNRTNTAYVVGRRSSNNVVDRNRTNIIKDKVIVNKDVVIDRAILKLKRNNNNIRVYKNPNNVPNNLRNYNRVENSNNSFRNNNNNIRNYSTPVRNYNNNTFNTHRVDSKNKDISRVQLKVGNKKNN